MKKSTFILVLITLIVEVKMNAQNSITVFTKDSLAEFQLYVDGDRKNSLFMDSMTISGLDSSEHKITVSFKNKQFADKSEIASFIETNHRIYKITQKPGVLKSFSKLGRKIGKKAKIGEHDKDKDLQDIFYLKDITVLDQFSK